MAEIEKNIEEFEIFTIIFAISGISLVRYSNFTSKYSAFQELGNQ